MDLLYLPKSASVRVSRKPSSVLNPKVSMATNIRMQHVIQSIKHSGNNRKYRNRKGCGYKAAALFWHALKKCLPLLLLAAYIIIGAAIFYHAEHEQQLKKQNGEITQIQVQTEVNKKSAFIAELAVDKWNESDFQEQVRETLLQLTRQLGCVKDVDIGNWTYTGSLFYCSTLITTIGYGNIAPITTVGKLGSVLYSVLGIPLTLYVLADTGQLMCYVVWQCYVKLHIYLSIHCSKSRSYEPGTNFGDFPLSLAIFITMLWTVVLAVWFSWSEEKSTVDSIWYSFQSLTTIGLGDVVPSPRFMTASFIQIVIGLALVSMCWNLVQAKVKNLTDEISQRIQNALVEEATIRHVDDECCSMLTFGDDASDLRATDVNSLVHLSSNNPLLSKFLNESAMNSLAKEWSSKARQRNKTMQTDDALCFDESNQTHSQQLEHKEQQTTISALGSITIYREPHPCHEYTLPVKNSDPFRENLRNLRQLLNECHQLAEKHE